jgi:iron complex outermembrane receptor protein
MSQPLYSLAALAALLPFGPACAAVDTGSRPAAAAETPADSASAEAPPATAQGAHRDHDDEIVVTGVRRSAGDVLGGVSVLDKADLTREVRPSIGETLARQPGVSSTSFGPTASSPVLRGLSGDRVRVLTDGIGSLDLSSSGPDHAIAINPLTAERIEVLRGPAALLFGSSAIGGVVNVIDARIPRHPPDGPVGVDALANYGSAANERSVNVAVDAPLGGRFVLHGDGSYSRTGDLRTGGHLLSGDLRAEALASPDPAIRALAGLKGKLPNTAGRAADLAAGVAYVDGALNIGLSISRHTSRYGVPIRFSLDPAIEAEAPTIDARQTRGDLRAELPLNGFFDQARARAGISRYRHDEIEDNGEIGSSFFSNGGEGRAELVQAERSGWGGTSGVQYLDRDARIRGEEKFLPDSRQKQAGLFTLQTLVKGPLRLEAGGRVEFSRLTAEADEQLGTAAGRRKFTTFSASLGGSYEFTAGWRAGLSVSSSARAPAIDELFANGPHGGSQTFERGNPDLDPERSLSVEAGIHHTTGPVHLTGNLFTSRFSNFIFQAPTGEIEDGLPVFEFRQGRAHYQGFEIQGDAKLGQVLGIDLGGEFVADAVRATIKGFGPAPRIPPVRLLGALTAARGPFDGRLEVEHAFAQRRTAPLETPTPGYTLVNASLDWHPLTDKPELTLSLAGNNLFDVVARRHSSLLKDYAPLAGRDIRLSARLGF